MDDREALKRKMLAQIVNNIPKAFWEDARARTKQAYMDIFHQVKADPNLLDGQRPDKLHQDRHFRMEHVLAMLAKDHGFVSSATYLVENNRCYMYATRGAFGITQSYVPTIGALPQPAKFRARLAVVNDIDRTPRLDLGDEPSEIIVSKNYYGLLTHNPIGRRFIEKEQFLGMLEFCIPNKNFNDWVLQMPIEEIVSEYTTTMQKKSERKPAWKKQAGKKGDEAA
jgi:hypothetical protein